MVATGDGSCAPAPDGAPCFFGQCRAGACCHECWTGTACQAAVADACGGGGEECTACLCRDSTCLAGQCASAIRPLDVSSGGSHTCAVAQDGSLWCWGLDVNGQLNAGDAAGSSSPIQVTFPGDFAVVRRQLRFRPGASAAEIIDLLRMEAEAKPVSASPIGF